MGAISEFMGRDHDRLDAIFAEFQKAPDDGKAKEFFTRFDGGLRAHITWEEEILFPSFEEKTGMRDMGPTAVMRMEHRQIHQLLESIGRGIGPQSAAPARELVEVLTAHNHKEENILYPWLDESLTEQEISTALDRIRKSQVNA